MAGFDSTGTNACCRKNLFMLFRDQDAHRAMNFWKGICPGLNLPKLPKVFQCDCGQLIERDSDNFFTVKQKEASG